MTTAAIYVRKSKFTGKGESIKNQIDMCKQYARGRNLIVRKDLLYFDEGFSGGNTDRPEFQRMLNDAKKEKFDILICYRLDRISRSITDFSATMDLLQQYNISFISIREQFDTTTPMGRAMMYIASVFAQLERETIAERIRDNMLQLARTGRWLGGVTPTGFESKPIIYYDVDMKERKMYKLSPVNNELETVKTIFDKYLELKSLSKLETYCLQNNIKSKNNNDFKKNTLKNILNNPVYAVADNELYDYLNRYNMDITNDKSEFDGSHGVLVYNKNIETKGKSNRPRNKEEWIVAIANHKGIIPSRQWIEVQNLLKKNKKKSPRHGNSSKGLLSGLIKCGKCNQPMRIKYGNINPKTGERYYYYVCTLKENSRGVRCKSSNLKGITADQLIIEKVKDLLQDNNNIIKHINIYRKQLIKKNIKNKHKQNEIRKKISQNESKIANLIKQLYNNQNSRASKYIIKEIEKIDKENLKLFEKLDNKSNDLDDNVSNQRQYSAIRKSLSDWDNLFDKIDIETKKNLLGKVVENILWFDGYFEINFFNTVEKLAMFTSHRKPLKNDLYLPRAKG